MKFKILRFKKLKSTNDTAMRMIKNSNLKYGMIIAETQSKGRGQYGRKWTSLKGNLFVSFFYSLDGINLTMAQITKLNCLLVKKLISKYYKKRIFYKKPNDLLIKGKKICGILQERINKLNDKFLIVGIGINVDRSPKINNYPTTYVNLYSKNKLTSFKIYSEIKRNFEKYLNL